MPDLSLTAETLSRSLQCAGTLPRGAVTDLHVELEYETSISRLVFLTVAYTAESLTEMVQGVAAHLPEFFDAVGDALTADARKVYERVFSSSLKPWLRLTEQRALTIVHGDAHTWNFLFPRSGDGPAFLMDWQTWHVDVGARDLAFLMALHWYPSRRRELEHSLLRHYHEALLKHGRNDYSFDELWLDYRRCAVRNLTIPILFWRRGMKPEGWWHRLECALASYHDLDCDELI